MHWTDRYLFGFSTMWNTNRIKRVRINAEKNLAIKLWLCVLLTKTVQGWVWATVVFLANFKHTFCCPWNVKVKCEEGERSVPGYLLPSLHPVVSSLGESLIFSTLTVPEYQLLSTFSLKFCQSLQAFSTAQRQLRWKKKTGVGREVTGLKDFQPQWLYSGNSTFWTGRSEEYYNNGILFCGLVLQSWLHVHTQTHCQFLRTSNKVTFSCEVTWSEPVSR